jgi:amino acid transporter
MQVVLFTRIAVYALAGFECMSMVIAETRDGARGITRSIVIAVPCIAAIYILGTHSMLTYVPAASVDLVNPVSQTFAVAFGPFGRIAAIAAGAAILLVVVRDFAQASQIVAVTARLPLVAGWDRLLPAWFTRLHARTKTPVNAILFGGGVMFVSACGAIVAAGRQEAFQILLSIGGVFFSSTYFVTFSIPLVTRGTPWSLKIAAASGLVVTSAFIVLSFVPIVDVPSPVRYASIIAVAVVAANAAGAAVFAMGRVTLGREAGEASGVR